MNMDTMKEVIRKRSSKKKKRNSKPELSCEDLDFIAEHTSINKEDVSAT